MMKKLMQAGLCALGLALCNLAWAQVYPTKTVRIVVPFPPGGGTDVIARVLAQKLTESWGQQVIVENKAGASGTIGSDLVAKSAADGYTLLLTATHHAINLSMYKQLPYDTLRDFVPVAYIAASPNLLLLHPSVPANNVQELIAYVKSKPGGLNYASSSVGGATHLTGELFKTAAGIELQHIPYKGAAPAMTDLLGGQVPMMFDVISTALAHVRSGRLKAIAVTSAKRTTVMPEVPTVAESGIPGFEAISWFGLYAPAATPKDTVNRLNADFNRVLQLPEVKEKLAAQGAEPIAMTPEQFAVYLRAEIVKWAKAIRDSGAKAE
jgi:tripartite-type tricarboxylate transporter receptor subunit TctC